MRIEKKKVNFEDARGTIMDILVDVPKEHLTIIKSNKGAVRGNHYHKGSQQSDFFISGRMLLRAQIPGKEVTEIIAEPNDLVHYEIGEVHAMQALEDNTVFVTIVQGPRGGAKYEDDTFRVNPPLIAPDNKI